MRYHLCSGYALKRLEFPAVYHMASDELYELDEDAFIFLENCARQQGCEAEEGDKAFLEYCLDEGILSDREAPVRGGWLVKAPEPSLRYLELQITDRCNLRCRHCYIGAQSNRELPVTLIHAVLKEFESMQGLRLLITGGEPLMHSSFWELNALLPSYVFRKVLFTNGLLLDKKTLNALDVHEIQFSIDGMERGHEMLRGKGTYRKLMSVVQEALSLDIDVSAATMIHSGNLEEFQEMAELFGSMGLRDWTVDVPCVTGNMNDNVVLAVPPETAGRYLNYGFGGGLHGGGEGSTCGLHLMSVSANGAACKCAYYCSSPVGNITEGLARCWQRVQHAPLHELECASCLCPVIEECRGGCRYRAEACGGSLKRDLYKCFSYDIIKPNSA